MDDNTVRAETGLVILASKTSTRTVNIEARRGTTPIHVKTFLPDNAQKIHEFALHVGVGDEDVRRAIEKALQAPANVDVDVEPHLFTLLIRGITEPAICGRSISEPTPIAALDAALAILDHAAPEPILEWEKTETLAALDVDYHDMPLDLRPAPARLAALASRVRPSPSRWWTTHGCGLRLIYAAMPGMTADELAACAAVTFRSLDPTATVEIVAHTRHPGYPRPDYPSAGSVQNSMPTADLGILAYWLGQDAPENAVQTWLAERGLERGRRYSHDRCPADPTAPSHAEPLSVSDNGIYCFKCASAGICMGSRRPGYFPYAALLGYGLSSRLRTAARNFCHWEHAQHIMAEDIGLPSMLAKLSYSAILKAFHGAADCRTKDAMFRGKGLVRKDGYWATADLERAHTDRGLKDRLGALPAVNCKYGHELLGVFQGVDDLAPYGYPSIEPVRGMKIYGQFRSDPNPSVVRSVVLPSCLRAANLQSFAPRYVPAGKRMPPDAAEAVLNKSFPGIDFAYLRLLIAARGCAEGGMGKPPRIAVTGPSGAGKDVTVKVAAALIGDTHREVQWVPNATEFHAAIHEASQQAGFVSSPEIIKLIKPGNVC